MSNAHNHSGDSSPRHQQLWLGPHLQLPDPGFDTELCQGGRPLASLHCTLSLSPEATTLLEGPSTLATLGAEPGLRHPRRQAHFRFTLQVSLHDSAPHTHLTLFSVGPLRRTGPCAGEDARGTSTSLEFATAPRDPGSPTSGGSNPPRKKFCQVLSAENQLVVTLTLLVFTGRHHYLFIQYLLCARF